MGAAKELEAKITKRKAVVCVIGIGYVGLPLATEFAEAGFQVCGLDLDQKKVGAVNKGISYIQDVDSHLVKRLVEGKKLKATADPSCLAQADCVIICVPTPLNKLKEPDISYVLSAARMVRDNMKKPQLVILESTTYPGTTEEMIFPEIAGDRRRIGRDFFLCFSPERIDPGNRDFPLRKIPKVVGGMTPACAHLGKVLYSQVIQQVMEVSSPRVAEMAKLLENTFRIVNIGLINELAIVSQKLGINIWESIEAAKTKPFGFMPFYPGPGIGGHCIGIDPLYLSWKAKLEGSEIRFVELASRISADMPGYVVKRAAYALNERGKALSRAQILILGVAYKKNIGDVRESPALDIIEELVDLGAKVRYHDPFVKRLEVDGIRMSSSPISEKALKSYDMVIVITDHSSVNYEKLVKNAALILDTRNILKKFSAAKHKIILL